MNRSDFSNYVLFFISPVLALANAALNWRQPGSKNIVWLFACFYGLAFFVHPDSGSDCRRYIEWLQEMHAKEISFSTLRSSFYQEGERYYDLYHPILTFVISRFTDDYRVLFGAAGFVFGYFYSRVMFYFIDKVSLSPSWLNLYLIISIAFVLDIGAGINGMRMYTALFVFLFGALYYWETKRQLFLVIAASSIFVHFSYLIPVAILIASPAFRSVLLPVYLFFLASFVVTAIDVTIVRNFVESLPFGLESRVGGYLREFDPSLKETPRILLINKWMMHAFAICAASYLFSFLSRGPCDERYRDPLIFAMLLYGLVNILAEVGSIGRLYRICEVVTAGFLLLAINRYGDAHNARKTGAAIAGLLVLNSALGIRLFLGFSSANLLIGNPLSIWILSPDAKALYDYFPPILRGL